MASERSPGFKLMMVAIIAAVLAVPLMTVYALVWDRQSQSNIAQNSIAAGWGGPQIIAGPVLVIPYVDEVVESVEINGKITNRTVRVTKELFLAPERNRIKTGLTPDRKTKSIYESILFVANNSGEAKFALPADFERYGISRDSLNLSGAELRFGVSDARGLQVDGKVTIDGIDQELQPGKGLAATRNSGFFTFVDWSANQPMTVKYSYAVRGNKSMTIVPHGGQTEWVVTSTWPSPSFGGDFLPEKHDIKSTGFSSHHSIANLALGQALVTTDDAGPPIDTAGYAAFSGNEDYRVAPGVRGPSLAATIALIEPVDLYSQVDRAVKYGFLFIGFTFLAFLMFDVIAGARVAAAEYLLAGASLVLFFVLLLAFAEIFGFLWAYLIAAGAISGLLTAYSAAILKSWLRARIIGGLLAGLYATLYVLLNLEAFSLVIGSVLLFIALALVMWATRTIDWSARRDANLGTDIETGAP